jgi:TM2 domain-containing membrane protein YozV
MFRKRERTEIESFCGYCGERLPSLGYGAAGVCPNCSRRYQNAPEPQPQPQAKVKAKVVSADKSGGKPWYDRTLRAVAWDFVQGPKPFYRDPILAALLSTVLPGAGQVYNHQFLKGILILVTSWLVIPYFVGIIDAFITARSLNKFEIAVADGGDAAGR